MVAVVASTKVLCDGSQAAIAFVSMLFDQNDENYVVKFVKMEVMSSYLLCIGGIAPIKCDGSRPNMLALNSFCDGYMPYMYGNIGKVICG